MKQKPRQSWVAIVVQARVFSECSVSVGNLAWNKRLHVIPLQSLDFLKPVHLTFIRVTLVFTKGSGGVYDVLIRNLSTARGGKCNINSFMQKEIWGPILEAPLRIGLIIGHGLASGSYHEFISFCLFPLPFAVLIPFSGEIFTCNRKMTVAAQVEKQWEKAVCFPKSKNKILELSLMCL